MEGKSDLYIVAIVGVIAVIGIVFMFLGSANKNVYGSTASYSASVSNLNDNAGQAVAGGRNAACVGSSSQKCSVGIGACLRAGTQSRTCKSGQWSAWSTCTARAGTPIVETCNNIDDNCNGIVDENLIQVQRCSSGSTTGNQTRTCRLGTWSAWSTCISSCTAESNTALCSRLGKTCGSVTATDNCGASRTVSCGTCASGQTCTAGTCVISNTSCTSTSVSCTVGIGACARSGTQTRVCTTTGGYWTNCSAVAGTPTAEICNSIDDDCDGLIDDGCSNSSTSNISQFGKVQIVSNVDGWSFYVDNMNVNCSDYRVVAAGPSIGLTNYNFVLELPVGTHTIRLCRGLTSDNKIYSPNYKTVTVFANQTVGISISLAYLYTLPSCGDGVCNNGEICSSCASDCGTCNMTTNTCNDTDGGVNYYVRGEATMWDPSVNSTWAYADGCLNNVTLQEMYCDPVLGRPNVYGNYNCPKGCTNGACNTKVIVTNTSLIQ